MQICRYARTPTLAAVLISARAWLVEVTQLKAWVAGLQFATRHRDTGDDLLLGETIARIRAAQDHLAVLSEQVGTKRPYGAVEADHAGTSPQGAEPSAKRQRHDYGRYGGRASSEPPSRTKDLLISKVVLLLLAPSLF